MYEVLDVANDAYEILSDFVDVSNALNFAFEATDGRRHIIVRDTDTRTVYYDDEQV